MKKLSSDILFYQGLAGLILGPILIFFFIRAFFVTAFPPVIIPFFHLLLAYIIIRGCYGVYKDRRIFYDNNYIFLQNYFSKKSIQIPISDIISIAPSFTLYSNTSGRKRYTMTYMHDGKKNKIKFFKSLELYHVNNIENLIGLQQYKSVIINQHIQNSNSIIAASLKIDRTTRFTSAVMDHVIMTISVILFSLPYMISTLSNKTIPKPEGILFYIMNIGFALYFCKDCIYGQSIAKRILKQQVINNKTGEISNPLRCLVRDLFLIIWPVEVIMLWINPQRRLGDIVAGTRVIEFDPELKRSKLNYMQIFTSFLLVYLIILLVTILFSRY